MGTRKRESFSSIEVLSVVAIILIIVMIAIPRPYTSWNHGFPASREALSREFVPDNTRADALRRTGQEDAASFGYAVQGSPFEVRTVGRREFCSDQPGVVRFSTTGSSCKNGTLATNIQPHREQPRP